MDRLESKIMSAVARSGLDAIMAVGVDNFNYLTRTVLPFANNYPDRIASVFLSRSGESFVLCPFDWSEAVKDQGWGGEIHTYDENKGNSPVAFVRKKAELLETRGFVKKEIGIDYSRASKGLMDVLRIELPNVTWKTVDVMLRDLRIVKTPMEVELIETACKYLDRGIIHALNHLEGAVKSPGYTVPEFTERIRVHICENGGSGIGYMSTTLGPVTKHYYAPNRGVFNMSQPIKIDISSHYRGYWGNIGRMAFTGKPTPEYAKAFSENLKLKYEAIKMLKPGVACNTLYEKLKKEAEEENIQLWSEVGLGHGVGASHYEPPYLNSMDHTEFMPGMVVALDVNTYGPNKTLIHSKDIYVIEEEGCRHLSWYRNWDQFYEVTGFRASH